MPKATTKNTETPRGGWEYLESLVHLAEDRPDDAVVVTYSELDSFRQCPLKHRWSYREKYRREPKVGSALSRGTLWHQVMECHYLLLRDLADRQPADRGTGKPTAPGVTDQLMQFALQQFLVDQSGAQNEDQEKVEWIYQGYLEAYGIDEDWEPVVVEQAGEVPLDEDGRYWLRFKVDLVVRDRRTGMLWLVDHKTASQFSKPTEIELDDQFRLYTWALRKLGVPVEGIVRSDSRTQRNKGPMTLEQRFRRVTSYCSEVEGANVAADALRAARAAYESAPDQDGKPLIPIYASPAPDRCVWRCDYLQVHLDLRRGLGTEEQLLRDFGFTRSDEKHREYAEDPVATQIRQGDLHLT